jgi:SAM-dependent methyltransferase
MEREKHSSIPFRRGEVEEYERKRYRGIDQKLVHMREKGIIQEILKRVGDRDARALDVPCGYGRFSSLLLEQGMYLASSDLSFHMVKRAIERDEESGWPLGVVADCKLGLPFKDGVFSLLLSMRFFHHLHQKEERKAVLEEFSRVTKEWVVLSYYQMNLLHHLQRKLRRKIKKSKTRIKMISRGEFERELREKGFKIVRIFPLFKGIHSHHIALLKK